MASYSMAKTIVAMLVGVALADGKITSLDDRADKYVPELNGLPYGETPLRHLLSMSSGVRFTENYSGSDDVFELGRLSLLGAERRRRRDADAFPYARSRPRREVVLLVGGDSGARSGAARARPGEPLAEYLSERIWRPMGAEADASWNIDKGGYEVAFIGVNATVRDYARFGLLLANDGARQRPADHSASLGTRGDHAAGETVRARTDGLILGYGYQTWIVPATSDSSCCGDCGARRFSWIRSRRS